MRDHAHSGVYKGHRECHIESDLLSIYCVDEDTLILVVRPGLYVGLLDS